jgi:hypothetical protein
MNFLIMEAAPFLVLLVLTAGVVQKLSRGLNEGKIL